MLVIAHECGHNAFSDNRFIQDAVGYALHSVLLAVHFQLATFALGASLALPTT